jgi:methionyl-tRNA formyltransferase
MNGESVTGITTMYMDTGLDTGDMILKAEAAISPEMTTGELHDELKELGAKTLLKTIDLIAKGEAPRTAQPDHLATYAAKLTRDIEKIDWCQPSLQIHNLVRGLNPYPACYTSHEGKKLKIYRAQVYAPAGANAACGQVVSLTKDGFLVQTGSGILEVLEVQPESKRRMGAGEYARGYFLKAGEILK